MALLLAVPAHVAGHHHGLTVLPVDLTAQAGPEVCRGMINQSCGWLLPPNHNNNGSYDCGQEYEAAKYSEGNYASEVKFSLPTLTLHRLWFIGPGAKTFLHICRIGNFVVDRSHRRTGTEDFRLIYFRSHFRSEFVAWKFLSGSTGNKRSSDTLDSILLLILGWWLS